MRALSAGGFRLDLRGLGIDGFVRYRHNGSSRNATDSSTDFGFGGSFDKLRQCITISLKATTIGQNLLVIAAKIGPI